jgi:hypothetical protein
MIKMIALLILVMTLLDVSINMLKAILAINAQKTLTVQHGVLSWVHVSLYLAMQPRKLA